MIGQAALSWSSAWTAHAGCSGGCCCLTALGSPPFRRRGLRRSLSWRLDESEAVAAWHNGSALCRGLAPRYNMTCDDDHCAEGRPRRRAGLSAFRFVGDPARAGQQAFSEPLGKPSNDPPPPVSAGYAISARTNRRSARTWTPPSPRHGLRGSVAVFGPAIRAPSSGRARTARAGIRLSS